MRHHLLHRLLLSQEKERVSGFEGWGVGRGVCTQTGMIAANSWLSDGEMR